MPLENHHQAAKLFRPDPRLLHATLPPLASGGLRPVAMGHHPPLASHALRRARPGVPGRKFFLPRCCRKGCVFPAQPGARGECAYHRRELLEPGCFQSQQPSFLLLDQARFGLPDCEPEDGRVQDRHRLAAERVRFMLEDAA